MENQTLEKPSREDWLIARQKYLGGTDVAALVDRNKYASPMSVYADKVLGHVERSPEDMEAAEAGLALEPLVKEWASRDCGWVLSESKTYFHPKYSFLAVNPDAELGPDSLVEIKTYGFRTAGEWGEEGTDQIPDAYHVQCIWQLGISGKKVCYVVACERGSLARKYYRVESDPAYFNALVQIAVEFWQSHIEKQVPPKATGHKSDSEAVQRIYPRDSEVLETSSSFDDAIATELIEVHAELKQIEEREEALKAQLKASVGDSCGIQTIAGKFTWKAAKESAKTDWKGLCAHLISGLEADSREALIAQFTTYKPGSRRFEFPKS